VATQDGGADAIQVVSLGVCPLQRWQRALPVSPLALVVGPGGLEAGLEAGAGPVARFSRVAAKAQSQDNRFLAGAQVYFAGEGDVAILRPLVRPGHLLVLAQVLPAIGGAHKARGAPAPRRGASQGQGVPLALGEEHRHSLVISYPGGVAGPPVAQVRGQQGVKVIVRKGPLGWRELHSLQHDVVPGIGHYVFLDGVLPLLARVGQPVCRASGHGILDLVFGVALFLRKEILPVGDDQAQVADARLIHAGVVDLVQDAVANGEPHAAAVAQGGAHSTLGAGRPARWNTRPAWCTANRCSHWIPLFLISIVITGPSHAGACRHASEPLSPPSSGLWSPAPGNKQRARLQRPSGHTTRTFQAVPLPVSR
jgi:hypothetical protein